jgi:hypothetical protein
MICYHDHRVPGRPRRFPESGCRPVADAVIGYSVIPSFPQSLLSPSLRLRVRLSVCPYPSRDSTRRLVTSRSRQESPSHGPSRAVTVSDRLSPGEAQAGSPSLSLRLSVRVSPSLRPSPSPSLRRLPTVCVPLSLSRRLSFRVSVSPGRAVSPSLRVHLSDQGRLSESFSQFLQAVAITMRQVPGQ